MVAVKSPPTTATLERRARWLRQRLRTEEAFANGLREQLERIRGELANTRTERDAAQRKHDAARAREQGLMEDVKLANGALAKAIAALDEDHLEIQRLRAQVEHLKTHAHVACDLCHPLEERKAVAS